MKKLLSFVYLITFSVHLFFMTSYAQNPNITIIEINDEIDEIMLIKVQNAIEKVEYNNQKIVLLHINTYGGYLAYAFEIRDLIIKSNLFTIAFIDTRAISAGALISLACKKIAIAPGSVFGASTVVNFSDGLKSPEKYQSLMRSMMRSTAEINKRRIDIAEGMVDESIEIEGITKIGKLITLTTDEAIKYRMADGIANSLDEVLSLFQEEIKTQSINLKDEESKNFSLNKMSKGIAPLIFLVVVLFLAISTGYLFFNKNNANNRKKDDYLILKNLESGQSHKLVSKNIYIGRSSECDIILDDDIISKQHALISYRNDKYYIADLNSKNGTYLNGNRIKKSYLYPNDVIRVGSKRLKYLHS